MGCSARRLRRSCCWTTTPSALGIALYEEDGIEGLTNFSYEGSACQLSGEQQEKLKAWVATALPRQRARSAPGSRMNSGVVYEGRSGLIALLHRLGLEYHKPNVIPRKLDEEKQKVFIEGYEKLLNSLGDDEAALFADAVHPTHAAARPVGCWAPSQEKLAIEQTSGRQRINIHGAIDLETGQTRIIEALTIDAASRSGCCNRSRRSIRCWALIDVFLDNARYHHAKLVQERSAPPGRRIKLHFIPTYCPHLIPIERLWGLTYINVTHSKCYATCAQFADATLSFLRGRFRVIGRTSAIWSPTLSAPSTHGFSGYDVTGYRNNDAAQLLRIVVGRRDACEPNGLIAGKPVVLSTDREYTRWKAVLLLGRMTRKRPPASGGRGAQNQETAIHDREAAAFRRHEVEHVHLVRFAVGDVDKRGNVTAQINLRVHLHDGFGGPKMRPRKHFEP